MSKTFAVVHRAENWGEDIFFYSARNMATKATIMAALKRLYNNSVTWNVNNYIICHKDIYILCHEEVPTIAKPIRLIGR